MNGCVLTPFGEDFLPCALFDFELFDKGGEEKFVLGFGEFAL